jgi:uncharacterized protein YaiI (UPF0178 family)
MLLQGGLERATPRRFDAGGIGNGPTSYWATGAIMEDLRAGMDGEGGGPSPYGKADQSNFLQALDRMLVGMGSSSR